MQQMQRLSDRISNENVPAFGINNQIMASPNEIGNAEDQDSEDKDPEADDKSIFSQRGRTTALMEVDRNATPRSY